MSIRFVRAAALSFSLLAAGTAQAEPVPAVLEIKTTQNDPAPARLQAEGAPIDPARLEAATKSVDYILPKETYERIMRGTINGIMVKPMLSFAKTPLRDLAERTGVDEERLKAIGKAELNEVMRMLAPAYTERSYDSSAGLLLAMEGMIYEFEPIMKGGLARAYARRFDLRQLAELNAFFATPTGSAYAGESMQIYNNLEFMNSMIAIEQMMMKRMPDIVKTVEAEMARAAPKRRTIEELTPAERKTVNRLLGLNGDASSKD